MRLEGISRKCTRSVLRGLGAARQSLGISIGQIWFARLKVENIAAPLAAVGMVYPFHVLVLGSYFLTGEIELSAAAWQDLNVSAVEACVHWTLPVSKADTCAKGLARRWGCLCNRDAQNF